MQNNRNPLVSIILPTYNWNPQWISEAIESVLSQSYANFELIIINDASTNDVESVIVRYVLWDKRIRYSKNEINLKLTRTLNEWIDMSKWIYIARIDDEDIWTDRDKLKKQVAFLEKHLDYWLCWTNARAIDNDKKELFKTLLQRWDGDIRKKMLFGTQFLHVSVLFRKACIDIVWSYRPEWNLVEDHELWLRIWKNYKFYNLQDCCVDFRVNPSWTSMQNRRKQRLMCFQLCSLYQHDYPNHRKALLFTFLNMLVIYLPMKLILFLMKIKQSLHKLKDHILW